MQIKTKKKKNRKFKTVVYNSKNDRMFLTFFFFLVKKVIVFVFGEHDSGLYGYIIYTEMSLMGGLFIRASSRLLFIRPSYIGIVRFLFIYFFFCTDGLFFELKLNYNNEKTPLLSKRSRGFPRCLGRTSKKKQNKYLRLDRK